MNPREHSLSDEQLYAFIDGELDETQRAQVAAAIDADPALAQRVAQQRAMRQLLGTHFDPVMAEPVPERLRAAIAPAPVADLAKARAERQVRSTSGPVWQPWVAQAAALALGILLGAMFFTHGGASSYVERDGELLARGALESALSDQLAGEAAVDGAAISLTIRTRDGDICRSFTLDAGQAGLACREQNEWRIDMLTRAARTADGYRQAGSTMPDTLRLAIEASADGEPLSAEDEAIARKAGWHAE
jgi:hypothetical protein